MHFDLNKEAGKVKFLLEKYNLPNIVAEVVAAVDVSGSTQDLFGRGTMQEAIQRVLPVAIKFDDNGEVPVYTFNDGDKFDELEANLTAANYQDFVQREIMNNSKITKWGGTAYAPVTDQILKDLGFLRSDSHPAPKISLVKRLFGGGEPSLPETFSMHQASNSGSPALIYTYTDGVPDDRQEIKDLIRTCVSANTQAYFNYIGVGRADFKFLHQIADEFPNVGFAAVVDIERVAGSDEIYEYLLPSEMLEWLKASKK